MTITNDFDVWDLDTPMMEVAAGGEFDFFQDERTPIVSTEVAAAVTQVRRRASID